MSTREEAGSLNLTAVGSPWRSELLARVAPPGVIRVQVADRLRNFLPAWDEDRIIEISGHLGDYPFFAMRRGEVILRGQAGRAAGLGMAGGTLSIAGNVGDYFGCEATGGTAVAAGDAGRFAAANNSGADVCIAGDAGDDAAAGMNAGSLLIAGNCGERLGVDLRAGTIYLRGDAKSLSDRLVESRLKEQDRLKLGLILLQAELPLSAKDFRVFRSRYE